jgi:enoyl-CoA hydratase/carnithine racemase
VYEFQSELRQDVRIVRLGPEDGTNRLTRARVLSLTEAVCEWAEERRPLILTGNEKFFSAGAELEEIAALNGPTACEFSRMGQS